jgi:hypothetical protein
MNTTLVHILYRRNLKKNSDQQNTNCTSCNFLRLPFDSTGKRCNIRNNLQKNDRTSDTISASEGLSCTECMLRMVKHAYKYQERKQNHCYISQLLLVKWLLQNAKYDSGFFQWQVGPEELQFTI